MTILPIVIHDDIELWACDRLRELLLDRTEPYTDDVYVGKTASPIDPSTGQPKRRDRMVVVRRDGGGRLDAVREAPRLGINVWFKNDGALSQKNASDLARMVAALLWASPDGDPVSRVTVTGGPYPVEEASTHHVYYITAELISKGRDA